MKRLERKRRIGQAVDRLWPRRRHRVLAALALGFCALSLATLSPSMTAAAHRFFDQSWKLRRIGLHVNPFRTRHALLNSGLPVFDLKISRQEQLKIDRLARAAAERGLLTDDLKQWSKATFISKGVEYRVKVRVRGDHPHHWVGPRKSWRVVFPKKTPFDGLQAINLILTEDTKALSEKFTNAVFREQGMLTHRDGYTALRVNGVPHGLYYWVEHPTEALLAHRARAHGPVFMRPLGNVGVDYKQQVAPDDTLSLSALQLLHDFEEQPTRSRFRAACAVTDMSDWLGYLTLTTLFYSDHTYLLGDNHKLYYDRSRGAFYRLPWDIHPRRIPPFSSRKEVDVALPGTLPLIDVFERFPMSQFRRWSLLDPAIALQRDRLLWDWVKNDRIVALFDETFEPIRLPLWADHLASGNEWHQLESLRRTVVSNTRLIREALSAGYTGLRIRMSAPHVIGLRFTVINLAGIIVDSIQLECDPPLDGMFALFRDANSNGEFDAADVQIGTYAPTETTINALTGLDLLLSSTRKVDEHVQLAQYHDLNPTHRRVMTCVRPVAAQHDFFLVRTEGAWPEALRADALRVTARNAVTGVELEPDEMPTRSQLAPSCFDPVLRLRSVEALLQAHSFLESDPQHRDGVTLQPGTHVIDGEVVIPHGVTLRLQPGTRLDMRPGASIIAFGPVSARGTARDPIRIGPAGAGTWGTFAVVSPGAPSRFEHVEVTGGGGATVQGVWVTGALAVHHGDVAFADCRFEGNSAEDALNVKDAHVDLVRCTFSANASDSLDLDFTSGSLSDCRFIDQAGDAIDCSGSSLEVAGCQVLNAGDKGISIGEQSKALVRDCVIERCNIGVAVKDLSQADVQACRLNDNASAFAVYCKKPIFGGARAVVHDSEIAGTTCVASVDRHSSIAFRGCSWPDEATTRCPLDTETSVALGVGP